MSHPTFFNPKFKKNTLLTKVQSSQLSISKIISIIPKKWPSFKNIRSGKLDFSQKMDTFLENKVFFKYFFLKISLIKVGLLV